VFFREIHLAHILQVNAFSVSGSEPNPCDSCPQWRGTLLHLRAPWPKAVQQIALKVCRALEACD
jgi:hypothetical protein